jgi:hypothetical protein
MIGFRFIKTRPTDYVILFRNGKARRHGTALSFFYHAPSSSLVIVPAGSRDEACIFNETTVDFQTVAIQGQITYSVIDPLKLATLLDFSVDADGSYTGDGIEKLSVRLTNTVQITLREKLKSLTLREALTSGTMLVEHVRARLKENETLRALGLELLDFTILQISPTPEIARALEATSREMLLKEADQAIYERRNFAVEQERRIRENELQTQIAVEEKNRIIREEQMNAEIAVQEKLRIVEETKMEAQRSLERKSKEIEQEKLEAEIQLEKRRSELVASISQNRVEEAKAKSEAMRLELAVLRDLSPELVEALLLNQMDARSMVARAMRDLSRNADRIGNLNISPELLESLIKGSQKK